jgi:hypothetical protein
LVIMLAAPLYWAGQPDNWARSIVWRTADKTLTGGGTVAAVDPTDVMRSTSTYDLACNPQASLSLFSFSPDCPSDQQELCAVSLCGQPEEYDDPVCVPFYVQCSDVDPTAPVPPPFHLSLTRMFSQLHGKPKLTIRVEPVPGACPLPAYAYAPAAAPSPASGLRFR